jgi:cytidine deaminase
MTAEVDWAALREAADAAAQHAYAPYSGLRVGAAALTTSGQVVSGCNVENASYGLTLCAECGLVSAAHQAGAGQLVAVSSRAPDAGGVLQPCGRCRQLLFEAGGPNLLVDGPDGPVTLDELLPNAFGPKDLPS